MSKYIPGLRSLTVILSPEVLDEVNAVVVDIHVESIVATYDTTVLVEPGYLRCFVGQYNANAEMAFA